MFIGDIHISNAKNYYVKWKLKKGFIVDVTFRKTESYFFKFFELCFWWVVEEVKYFERR